MAEAHDYPGGATELVVHAHAAELVALAARHGIHNLRFASTGRLLGDIDEGKDSLDMADFMADAEDLLGAPVLILSGAVLSHPRVSPDLVHASAL